MEEKQHWLLAAVNTAEALDTCVAEHVGAFCIEHPLYSEIWDKLDTMACLTDYDIEIHTGKHIAILRKARGKNRFDNGKYELLYLPLHWDGWTS